MPQNKAQRVLFAPLTLAVTVHAYVFFSLYVINGNAFIENARSIVNGPDAVRSRNAMCAGTWSAVPIS